MWVLFLTERERGREGEKDRESAAYIAPVLSSLRSQSHSPLCLPVTPSSLPRSSKEREMDAAIVGALVTYTLPKVIDYMWSKFSLEPVNVRSIKSELETIQATIGGPRWGRKKASLDRTALILTIRRLAADMEYSMDRFLVKATSASRFAEEIVDFKKRSENALASLRSYIKNEPEEVPPTERGVYNAEKDLLALLLESQSKVISVMGFGGQNTDFTTRVYDEVQEQFSQRAWVDAADQSVADVLTEILRKLEPGASPSDLKHQLESCISKERYLIVINDVRTREVYNELSSLAWDNKVGSRIVMTTNIQPVVRACICGDALPPLVPDSSTAGLVLVGGVCRMSYDETCFTLFDAAVARMEGLVGSDYERVLLEDCLLYFSMFPHGHNVRRNALIRRCLAEGILEGARKNLAQYANVFDEEIVGKHLDILVGHNMIKSIKKSNNGKVKRCQPPGIVFNHICSKALIENFFTLLCRLNNPITANQEYVHRLSLHPYLPVKNGGLNVPDVRHLLTMVVFPAADAKYESILSFENHKLLRVLDLKECADLNGGHVLKICEVLVLLKYLSLGNRIDSVPRIICGLKCLETLDMRRSDVVTVYAEVLMLPKLKHLLGKFQLASIDCPVENQGKLKGAKRLFRVKGKGFPEELTDFLMGKSVLETLAGIFIGNGKGLPQLLCYMVKLRKVKIWCDSTTQGSTDLTDLTRGIKKFTSRQPSMTDVEYSLSIDLDGPSQVFLYCLEDPDGRLTSLKLSGKLTLSPPLNTAFLISVQELCLSWTNLSGPEIQLGLGTLRCRLKFLKLVEKNITGLVIRNNAPFQDLKRLCLVGEERLDAILIQDLSKLVSLHLLCQTLGDLPHVIIGSLGNLNELGLHSGVAARIKQGWEEAAKLHQRKPNVVCIETH